MTSVANSLLTHLTRTSIRLGCIKGYSTTSKKVSALIYSEKYNSEPERTVIFLPSSRLFISKKGKLWPLYEATHIEWKGNKHHYLSGLPTNYDSDEEEGLFISTELQQAAVIPAEQESLIENLVKKIDELKRLKHTIQTDIDHTVAKLDDECKELSDFFK